jgi:hypothetical protein
MVVLFFSGSEAKEEEMSEVNVWEDNWDDDTVEDDFSVQLRWASTLFEQCSDNFEQFSDNF